MSMGDAARWCQPVHKPMAAPWQLHAVVRRRQTLLMGLKAVCHLTGMGMAPRESIIGATLSESNDAALADIPGRGVGVWDRVYVPLAVAGSLAT